jgi:hypothetical protein
MGSVALVDVDGRHVQSEVRRSGAGNGHVLGCVGAAFDRLVLMAGGSSVCAEAEWVDALSASASVRLSAPAADQRAWSWSGAATKASARRAVGAGLEELGQGRFVEDVVATVLQLADASQMQGPWRISVDVSAGVASVSIEAVAS